MLEFAEEHRIEQQQLQDGIMEMMNKAHYAGWMSKPRSGRLDEEEAYREMGQYYR